MTTWNLGKAVEQQQIGSAWTEGDDIVSLSLSSDLNIFDKRSGDKPSRVLYVCSHEVIHILRPHVTLCRPLRKASPPLLPRPLQGLSSPVLPTVASSHSMAPITDMLKEQATRI